MCLSDVDHTYARLWNPSINLKSKRSPTFDERICCYGFGYDHVNDKYKFFAYLIISGGDWETKTIIYTFGDNFLKTVEDFPVDPCSSSGKFLSGTLNWMVDYDDLIVSFDIVKETYRQVLLPPHDGYDVCDLYILSNCLSVCFNNSEECCWALWMMKEYGVVESWTMLMTLPHEKLLISNISYYDYYVVPLFISENAVVLLVNGSSSQVILYDLNSGGLSYPRILREAESDLHIYHESLLSPQW